MSGSCKLEALASRDSILPITVCLSKAASEKRTLHTLIADPLGRYALIILVKNCPTEKSSKILDAILKHPLESVQDLTEIQESENLDLNYLDGVRMTTSKNEIIHFRPSGNAPEFRCYTEADSQERADQIAQNALRKITQMISPPVQILSSLQLTFQNSECSASLQEFRETSLDTTDRVTQIGIVKCV